MSAAAIILAGSGAEEQGALEAAGYRLFFAPGADALRHVLRAELGDLLLVPADTPRADLPSIARTVSSCRANVPVVVVGEAAFSPAMPPRALSVIESSAGARDLIGLIEDRLERLQVPRTAAGAREGLGSSVAAHLERYFDAHAPGLPAPGIHGRIVREVERPLISLALGATGGNQLRAAALLGLNRNTLRKKIRELDIEVVRGIR